MEDRDPDRRCAIGEALDGGDPVLRCILLSDRRCHGLAHQSPRRPRPAADRLQPQEARGGTGDRLHFVPPVLREGDFLGPPGSGRLLFLSPGAGGKEQRGGETRPASPVRSSARMDLSLPPAGSRFLLPPPARRGRQDPVRGLPRGDCGLRRSPGKRQASSHAGLPGLSQAFGRRHRLHVLSQMRAPLKRNEGLA